MLKEYITDNEMDKNEMITFELDETVLETLEELAEDRSMTIGDLISEILELYIQNKTSNERNILIFEE